MNELRLDIGEGYVLLISKMDETRFRAVLEGGLDECGKVSHIDEIKNMPYYEKIKSFLGE